jgi:hypothetical protein
VRPPRKALEIQGFLHFRPNRYQAVIGRTKQQQAGKIPGICSPAVLVFNGSMSPRIFHIPLSGSPRLQAIDLPGHWLLGASSND